MFEKSLEVLRRQLPLVLVAVFLALTAAAGAYFLTPATQQSQAAVLLVPSVRQPGVEGATNPLLSLGGSVSIVASVVQIAVSDDETGKRLVDSGHSAKYEVVPDLGQNSGPVLLVTAEDRSAAQSQGTRDAVVNEIRIRLQAIQDERSVASDLRVSMVTLVSSAEPKPIHKTQIQFAVVAFLLVMSLTLLCVLRFGARADRRNRRRAAWPPLAIEELSQPLPVPVHVKDSATSWSSTHLVERPSGSREENSSEATAAKSSDYVAHVR